MRINKKLEPEMSNSFETALDCIPALEKVPFHIKREAAEVAAKVAFNYLRKQ